MGVFKTGLRDLKPKLYYRLMHAEAVHDISAAKYLVKWRGKDHESGKWLWGETEAQYRDITAIAKTLGGNGGADGVIGAPIFSGRTLPSAASTTETITNGKGLATFAAVSGNCIAQRIYITEDAGSTWYLAAEGEDGFAAAGVEIGGVDYPITGVFGTDLFEGVPTADRSQTNGFDSLGTPATPTFADVPGGAAGTLINGDYSIKLVNVAPSDAYEKRKIDHQFVIVDRETGEPEKFPAGTFELWIVGD